MNVAVTFVTATAVVGFITPPTRRYLHWAGTACLLLLGSAIGLAVVSAALLASGDWSTPFFTAMLALAVLFPAHWLSRTPDYLERQDDLTDEPEDEGGGGGGGPPTPPEDPPPAPPAPGLDWDSFDDLRESWVVRERELQPA